MRLHFHHHFQQCPQRSVLPAEGAPRWSVVQSPVPQTLSRCQRNHRAGPCGVRLSVPMPMSLTLRGLRCPGPGLKGLANQVNKVRFPSGGQWGAGEMVWRRGA